MSPAAQDIRSSNAGWHQSDVLSIHFVWFHYGNESYSSVSAIQGRSKENKTRTAPGLFIQEAGQPLNWPY